MKWIGLKLLGVQGRQCLDKSVLGELLPVSVGKRRVTQTERMAGRHADRCTCTQVEEKQADEPSQRLLRESTQLNITRHQNGMGTDSLSVSKHTNIHMARQSLFLTWHYNYLIH